MIFFLSVPFATPSAAASRRNSEAMVDEAALVVAGAVVVNEYVGLAANAARMRTNFMAL
jgi:hypothetical protein